MKSEDFGPERTVNGKETWDCEFFVLRTPLLPFEELAAWSNGLESFWLWQSDPGSESIDVAWRRDVQRLRDRLRSVVDRPEIVHALFLASPSLMTGIEHWRRDPDSKKGLQAERAMVRYFARMAGRSTPFGLFSGITVGRIADATTATNPSGLYLKSQKEYRPVSRLDFDYLFALTSGLQRDPNVRKELVYWPNSSLHPIADVWQYIESRQTVSGRSHHSVRLESDRFLEAVLYRARSGGTVKELVEAVLLQSSESEVLETEAEDYIQELITNDVLVSSFVPCVTGDPIEDLILQAKSLPSLNSTAHSLIAVREDLKSLDGQGLGVEIRRYEAIASKLAPLSASLDLSRLYQVDMVKPSQSVMLTNTVINELITGAEFLFSFFRTTEPEHLRTFREAFSARYDRAWIPLLDVLDEDQGIGFGEQTRDNSQLLRGIPFPRQGGGGRATNSTGSPFEVAHSILLRKLVECANSGNPEIQLVPSDLPTSGAAPLQLPDSFAVTATLVAASTEAIDQGDFNIWLKTVVGPGGARMCGRFCHVDPQLEQCVRTYLQKEEAIHPETIFAEIAYLPEGRIGNILCRPVLRNYELSYLGRSGAPEDRQIPLSDLLVNVQNNQIVLYSQRLDRRIIPCLTSAHGFMNPRLSSVYRFLCYLGHQQGTQTSGFSWGPLGILNYLPRVRMGRLILSTARWRLAQKEISAVGEPSGSRRFVAIQELRHQRRLPRWVLFEEGDNSLPVDLDNPLSVDAFVHVLKRTNEATLREWYASGERLCVAGPEGGFHHELNVPFIKRGNHEDRQHVPGAPAKLTVLPRTRSLAPGSQWLYLKLYAGSVTLDDILTKTVAPLVASILKSGVITRWFFIRFRDPHEHLRIRFNGMPDRLRQELAPVLSDLFNPMLESSRIWKVQFDTYEREIERYGGLDGAEAAEDLFFADSTAVLELLENLEGDKSIEYRWQVALLGIDSLLADFRLDQDGKFSVIKQLQPGEKMKKVLADKFRSARENLRALFDPGSEARDLFEFARKTLERRSSRIGEVVSRLHALEASSELRVRVADLIPSYIHMHVNRLMRSSANQHEIVLYDFLFRLYDGKRAREQKLVANQKTSLA